ncbi:MAG: class II aldolase/adducin family protein, partial [Chloroflexota bacterium]
MLAELRQQVYEANVALPQHNLVTWTSGNVSGRDPETGLVVIKPSGVMFEDLTPENMVVVDSDCNVVEGELGPSSDTASHVYVYN